MGEIDPVIVRWLAHPKCFELRALAELKLTTLNKSVSQFIPSLCLGRHIKLSLRHLRNDLLDTR